MSVVLVQKIRKFNKICYTNTEPHDLVKSVIEINTCIDDCFDNVLKDNLSLDDLQNELPALQKACLFVYMLKNNEIHRVRGNILASLSSLLFITESKIRLLVHDDDWCDLDRYYRDKSQFFFKDDFFNLDLFLENEINYSGKHPLVQFTMSDCHSTLYQLLLTKKTYKTEKELWFIKKLYSSVRDRVSIISNYAYSEEVNNMSEFTVCINNNRAIPTSSFLYDFSILCRELERNFYIQEIFTDTTNGTVEYVEFLDQIRPHYYKWAAGMIVTAAGDDFCDIFGKFFCKTKVKYFEELLYKRKFPSARIIYYKLLQSTRGITVANEFMTVGNDFVLDLLKRDLPDDSDDENDELDLDDPDSMCSADTVLERMEKLETEYFNTIMMGIIDYVCERQWLRPVNTFFTRKINPDVSLEPVLLRVAFTSKIVLFTKSQEPVSFISFSDAFAGFCYHLQKDYDGILYDKNGEKTHCTSLLKKMFAL